MSTFGSLMGGRALKRYIRFGLWGTRSANHATGADEVGVSVYTIRKAGKRWQLLVPDGTPGGSTEFPLMDLTDRVRRAARGGDPAFLVTGDVVGRGGDGEPLLSDVQLLAELEPSEYFIG